MSHAAWTAGLIASVVASESTSLRPGEAADHQHEDPRDHEPDPGGP